MQQEEIGSYFYTDPDFQRIEANIVKKECMISPCIQNLYNIFLALTRQQLENQRLSSLTTYHSRSTVQSEQGNNI